MSSVEGLQIETHQFDHDSYVLIRVDIGKMPPHAAKAYIARLRDETALCKMLDERNIRFDLVGVRDNGVSGLEIDQKNKEDAPKVSGSNNIAIGHDARSFKGEIAMREPRGSKVEKLPAGEELNEQDDLTHFRQQFLNSLAITNKKKMTKETDKQTVVASRNEILKTNDLTDELKHDSFADAMKLLDDQ